MSKNKSFSEKIEEWPAEKRIKEAKKLIRILTDRIQISIELHAANEIIIYSNYLSGQIPKSYAGHAFSAFQDAQFNFEIISLIAIWEKPDINSVSIPTVVHLIDDEEVLSELVHRTFNAYAGIPRRHINPQSDPKIQRAVEEVLRDSQVEFATQQSQKAAEQLEASIKEAKDIIKREQTHSIANVRNHLSHSLTQTRREQKMSIEPMTYGDERELLNVSIKLIEDLYCWVNGTSFDIAGDVFEQARRNARELWHNCNFDISSLR